MKARAWIQALRLKFLPQGLMPVLIGTAIAYRAKGIFDPTFFILAFFGMMLVQFGLTMLDDWHDYMRGTDTTKTVEKNPYSGGSGVLTDGTITPREMLTVVGLFYLIAAAIGLYLTLQRGAMVLYITVAGFFTSIFYSLKPFQFAYKGYGEFMMLLGYGPIITLGAYYVQAQELTVQAFLGGLLPGMLMWTMIIVNQIPDYEEDKRNNKRNLVVRFGKETGVQLFKYGLSVIYIYVAALVIIGIFPAGALLSLLSIIFALKALRYLQEHYQDRIMVAKANKEIVKVYSTTTILFTLGFLL